MKYSERIALCLCFLLTGLQLFAQNWVSLFPTTPRQSALWKLSSTNLPASLQSAMGILFQNGMADLRGCDYRKIEIITGAPWKVSGTIIKAHAFGFVGLSLGLAVALGKCHANAW